MFDYLGKQFRDKNLILCLFCFLSFQVNAGQMIYPTPDDASNVLVNAIEAQDIEKLKQILGADYQNLLPVTLITKEHIDSFINEWNDGYKLVLVDDFKQLLVIGKREWEFPIPLVKESEGWRFDSKAGAEEIRIRRIGRSELATIQTTLAYYDAQKEYAMHDHNGNGFLEYAQKFISSPSVHDGLYWGAEPDQPQSPLGPLLSNHTPDSAYHGYYYKILNAQGVHAKDGAYSYMIDNNMRSGFALIAWPADYGKSGVMSFMINHSGAIYQADLGVDSEKTAMKTQVFDPNSSWLVVEDVDFQNQPDRRLEKASLNNDVHSELKAFPPAEEGMLRFVITLPHKERGEEDAFMVELIAGKEILTDGVNKYRLGSILERHTVVGWGYSYYQATADSPAISTRMAAPGGAAQVMKFVTAKPIKIRYNSRLPIVVYVPENHEVRYRIWKAADRFDKTLEG